MFSTIAIAGAGVVGEAALRYFESQKLKTLIFDPPKGADDEAVLHDADIVFMCVPTPYTDDGTGFDLRIVHDVLKRITDEQIIVIKSTILPGTTEKLQKEYPHLTFLFSPEFLTEKTAVEDFQKPTRQLVGYTEKSKNISEAVLNLLPQGGFNKTMSATEAEMVKYMNNAFYALKVTYANSLYDLCKALNIDYNAVSEAAVTNEPWMGSNHWDVTFGGYRGYGGKCLPKDVRSLIQLMESNNCNSELLKTIEELNEGYTQQKV